MNATVRLTLLFLLNFNIVLQRVKGPDHIGIVLITGGTNWDLNGRKSMPKGCKSVGRNLYEPHLFAPLKDIRVRLVVSSCNSAHTIFITEEGKALSLGIYEVFFCTCLDFSIFHCYF